MSRDAYAGAGCAINTAIAAIVLIALTLGGAFVLVGQWIWQNTHFN
jgi:hypothetical protein